MRYNLCRNEDCWSGPASRIVPVSKPSGTDTIIGCGWSKVIANALFVAKCCLEKCVCLAASIGGFVLSQPSTQKKWDSPLVRLKVASTWSVAGPSPRPGNSHCSLFLAVCKFCIWFDGLLAFAAFCRHSLQLAGLLSLPSLATCGIFVIGSCGIGYGQMINREMNHEAAHIGA